MNCVANPSNSGKESYEKIFPLGFGGVGAVALAPTESKADDGFRVYVNPGYQQDRPYYYGDDRYRYYRHADEYRWHRWHRYHYDRDYDRD
jgi:hypothetical protein